MPDQTTQTATNVGDVIDAKQLPSLPIGAAITDNQGDVFVRLTGDEWQWKRRNGREGLNWRTHALVAEMPNYSPVRLTSLPGGASSMGQPDLFQQARVALRDRYGVEPTDTEVNEVVEIMAGANLTPSAAVMARTLRLVKPEPMPPHNEAQAAEHEIADTLLLVVVRGTDAATKLVVSADTTAGLARLRAHSALDALLDQHGISR